MDAMLGDCSLENLRSRRSYKWRLYPPDVLPAFVAEMDFDIAEPIKQAVVAAVRAGDCGYAKPEGLGEAYADFSRTEFGWGPDPAYVYAVPDVMTGVAEILLATTTPGARVVINPPVYPPFFFRTELIGRRLVEAPLARDSAGGYTLDPASIERALHTPGVEAYVLCSPHNPVGRVWSRDDLLTVADLCAGREVTLIVDEIHGPLNLSGATHIPFSSLDHEMAARAFTLTSATKAWNIAGLKCGLAVVGSDTALSLLEARWEALLAGHLGVFASIAAFSDGGPWLSAVRRQLAANRETLGNLVAAELPGVGYVPPEASFLAWLDCRSLGLGDDPASVFLEKGRVALSPGLDFGSAGSGHARLNIGTSPELIREAVDRMRSVLA